MSFPLENLFEYLKKKTTKPLILILLFLFQTKKMKNEDIRGRGRARGGGGLLPHPDTGEWAIPQKHLSKLLQISSLGRHLGLN